MQKKIYNHSNKLEMELAVNEKEHIKTVGVFTENDFLFQKIKLSLPDSARAVRLWRGDYTKCDLTLVDGEDDSFSDIEGLRIKREGGDIPFPFRINDISMLLTKNSGDKLLLMDSGKTVRIGERSVKLTELEYALLSLLVSANGEYVERERILSEVWGKRADAGIINVYVHYLREKLETDGEKIIMSSRNFGYRINEKFLGGTKIC